MLSMEGEDRKKPNNKIITSTKINRIKQNRTLLISRVVVEIGEDKTPSKVPVSFSLTNNFAITNNIVKNIINQTSMTKISIGIISFRVPK